MSPKAYPKWIVVMFFLIGIVSAIGFRSLIFFASLNPELFRPVWYCSVFGYILFFGYRSHISRRRRFALHYNGLFEKVIRDKELDREDKDSLKYILKSLDKSKENYNYMAIFVLSIVAVICDMILHA